MKRDPFGVVVLGAVLVVAAGMAGVTRFPEAGWVRALSRAYVFGPWIESFADLYRRPVEVADSDDLEVDGGPTIVYELDLERAEARPRIWVQQGTILFEAPSEAARRLATLPATTNLPLFDRQDDWYRVRFGDQKGWVMLPAYQESSAPPFGSEPDPPLPVAARPPDEKVLAEAMDLLDGPAKRSSLGGYALYTDAADAALLADLSVLVDQLEPVYADRYGLTPLPGAAEAVVLFGARRSYVAFRSASAETGFLDAPALVRGGVVATFIEDRSRDEIASSLIHELTHLLNRRAVGPALAPWLDEGLADDIAQSRIEDGRIVTGTLGGLFRRTGNATEFTGGRAAAVELQRALDRDDLPSLATLLELDWHEFQTSGARSLRYGQSSFFVRSLLDSPDPELARGFRAFLADVASGRPLTPEALRVRLDRSWETLDRRFESFVRLQVVEPG